MIKPIAIWASAAIMTAVCAQASASSPFSFIFTRPTPEPSTTPMTILQEEEGEPENTPNPTAEVHKEAPARVLPGGFAALPIDDSPGLEAPLQNYLPDNAGYEDESLSVRIERRRAYDTDIMLAYVKIADPSQMRTAMAAKYGSTKVVFPKVLAERANAVFAVNGDYFNYRATGYLVRQGELYRDRPDPTFDLLIIDDQGDFHIIQDPTEDTALAFEGNIINSFNFGPALVIDGQKVLPVKYFDAGTTKKAQRMAACQIGPLSYLFVATEGPENEGSLGLTVEELVEYVGTLGVKTAYNLDGGSSSAMILQGEKINALSARKNRYICDILYFSTLIPAR